MMNSTERDFPSHPTNQIGQMGGPATGRPVTMTTTTTTTTSPTYTVDWLKFNIDYFKTLPGILKLVQWVLGIFCMGFGSPSYNPGGDFFLFVVVLTFICTFFWICIYFFSIREGLQIPIPWVVPEFYYTAGATFFFLIAFIVQFAAAWYSRHTVSAIFGMFNFVAYGLGAFFLYKEMQQETAPMSPNV